MFEEMATTIALVYVVQVLDMLRCNHVIDIECSTRFTNERADLNLRLNSS